MTPEYCELQARLATLEKQNRTFRRTGIALLVALGAVLLMGQAAPKQRGSEEIISTQRLVLTDAAGKVRAFFDGDANGKGPSLGFYNLQGESSMTLYVDADSNEPTIALVGKNGTVAHIQPNSIEIVDSNDRGPAMRIVSGVTGFVVQDSNNTRAALVLKSGEPGLALFDKHAKPTALLTDDENGPRLGLWDAQGYSAIVGVDGILNSRTGETYKTSAASLVLRDKDEHVIWQAP